MKEAKGKLRCLVCAGLIGLVLADVRLLAETPPSAGGPAAEDAALAEQINEQITTFDCGMMMPEEGLAAFRSAVAAGQLADPGTLVMPELPVHAGVPERGGGVPTVTAADIFAFEDTADLLVTDFSDGQLFGLMADATRALLAREGDRFDFVAFFLNFNAHHTIGAAFYLGLENHTTGLGQELYNSRPGFGIPGENVEGWVMMWNQASWGSAAFRRLVLGQEFEHRWGMFLNDLSGGRALQGDDAGCGRGGHWNFKVDGQGSGMEIREWQGAPNATRVGGTLSFNWDIDPSNAVWSYPDLYLMGYVSPAEMNAGASELRYMNTGCGTSYNGVISTWNSSDVIAANGTRVPTSATAQKDFHTGWIMIHRPSTPPTAGQLNNVVNYLNQWSTDWNFGSLGRGTMDNTLFRDCNGNTITDSADIAAGTSDDCNPNAVPDECELAAGSASDCNLNGRLDVCDLDLGVSQDCQPNAVPDECDIASGASQDCTANSTPDECETDCNSNGVRDDCDIAASASQDCNVNAMPDECEIAAISQVFDCNSNGAPDGCDLVLLASQDCNATGIPDECDGEVCVEVWGGFEPAPPFTVGSPIHNIDYDGDGRGWDNPSISTTIGNQGCPAATGKAVKSVSQVPPTTDYTSSEFFRTTNAALHDGAPVQSLSFDVRSEAQLNPRIDWQLAIKDGTNDLSVILIHWASTQSNYVGLPAGQRGKILVQDPTNPAAFLTLSPAFTIPPNTCYKLRVVLNNVANTVELYINDTLRLTTRRLQAEAGRLDYFRLEQKSNGQASGGLNRLALDNFQLCYRGSTLSPLGPRDSRERAIGAARNAAGAPDASAYRGAEACAGVPAAVITGGVSRKSCDLPLALSPGVTSEPRQGGVSEVRIAFNVALGASAGPSPVTLERKQCPSPGIYTPYIGGSVITATVAGNDLVVTFTPALENRRTYRLNIGSSVTSVPGQFVEVRGLVGDVNSDGLANATDRSVVVGVWTGGGFTCPTDLNGDATTNATDRSIVVGAWTGGQNCAP